MRVGKDRKRRNGVGGFNTWRKRWVMVLMVVIVAGAGLVVRAVHDTGVFELDGNAVTNGIAPLHDWDKVYADDLTTPPGTTSGATAISFAEDSILGNGPSLLATIFTGGGSKDPQFISQWAWKDETNAPPDKDNLLHSFAARYSLTPTNPANVPPGSPVCFNGTGGPGEPAFDPTIKCEVLYFGSDRYDNSGDATQAFWFFQNEIGLGSNSVGGGKGFTGEHKPGDMLIISDFSNGGTTSTIDVLKWDPPRGTAPNLTGCVATGKAVKPDNATKTVNDPTCADANLRRLASSTNANCATAAEGDAFCGIVNPGPGLTDSPWPFLDKSGNSDFANGELYEGGVNLTKLGLGGECFASIASETRSSTSTTAVLKDFVLGSFARCDSGLVTTPQTSTGTNIVSSPYVAGTGTISIGTGTVAVRDHAELTISGAQTWTGSLSFALCGPADLISQATCLTGGTTIGGAVAISSPSPATANSAIATITSAGKYCWRSVFTSGTTGVPNATDATAGECFIVTPVTPALNTSATASVVLGNPITDTATLSVVATQPAGPVINQTGASGPAAGGTVVFKLYGPSATAVCTDGAGGNLVFTSSAITVSGPGTYGAGVASFTPTIAGTYRWIATYSGNLPNTTGPVSGTCGETNEVSVVTPRQPAISTVATAGPVNAGSPIDDVATLSGASPGAGGTITFSLYGPSASPVCTTAIATRVVNVSGNGNYTASTGTGTGSLSPSTPGTYYWIAVYSGDLPNTLGVSGACGDANEASIVQQLQPTISTAQTFTLKDSATITVASGAGNLAGSVRFRLYNNATCATNAPNQLLYDSITLHPNGIAVSGALTQTVESDVTTFTVSRPVLSWLVEYTTTNGGHKNVTSSCNVENAALAINNGGQ